MAINSKIFFAGIILLANAIGAKAQCNPTASATAVDVKATSALVEWQPVKGVSTYEYYVAPSPSVPPASGIIAAGYEYAIISNLQPNAQYDFCVRSVCSNMTLHSDWVCTTLQTTAGSACNEPVVLASAFNTENGKAEWATIQEAIGYEYSISEISPPASGAITTYHSLQLKGLTPAVYNVCVRAICKENTYSQWSCDTLDVPKSLGVHVSASESDVTVYPNPVTEELNITFPSEKNMEELTLTNAIGTTVFSSATRQDMKIDMRTYAPGLYMLFIRGMGTVRICKIVKE